MSGVPAESTGLIASEFMRVLSMLIGAEHKNKIDFTDFADIFVNIRASAVCHDNPGLSVDNHLFAP